LYNFKHQSFKIIQSTFVLNSKTTNTEVVDFVNTAYQRYNQNCADCQTYFKYGDTTVRIIALFDGGFVILYLNSIVSFPDCAKTIEFLTTNKHR
jgi:hypothetical protein